MSNKCAPCVSVYSFSSFTSLQGFFLTVSTETILTIAKCALDEKKTLAMNLSAPFIVQFFKDGMMSAMPYIDILFGNETVCIICNSFIISANN